MPTIPEVQFRQYTCTPRFRRYPDGGPIAIQLMDAEDGCPVATATVNIENPIPPGYVVVKTWSENEGMLETLVTAGLVADTGIRIACGYASAALCRLLVTPDLPASPGRASAAGLAAGVPKATRWDLRVPRVNPTRRKCRCV